MAGFWKIPKEWVQDWGLSGNEALLLADLLEWPNVSLEKRAQRVNMTKKGYYKAFLRLEEKPQVANLLGVQSTPINGVQSTPTVEQSTPIEGTKYTENGVQSTPNLKEKKEIPPTPPIKNKKENIKEQEEPSKNVDDEARAREERDKQLAEMGVVDDIKNLADELKKEIQQGGTVSESAMRLYGIPPDELTEYVGWFVDKLQIDGTQFKSRSDFRRHFNNWLRIQATERIRQQQNGKYSNRHSKPTADLFTELV